MHIPDGVIGPGASAAAGVVAVGGFGVAVSRARRYLTDRLVPMAALVTAFVLGDLADRPPNHLPSARTARRYRRADGDAA